MDNGNLRVFPTNVNCGTAGELPCNYSTAPLLDIDETANPKSATIISNYKPGEYSFLGGEVQQLANGHMEGDFNAGGVYTDIFQVLPGNSPLVEWHLQTILSKAYRGFRMPSHDSGVQWLSSNMTIP